MRLAEALALRGDILKRLEQVRARLLRNAKVQEGDAPAEDPAALLAEQDRLSAELQSLIARVNRTNSMTVLDRATMTDALAARDVLRLRQGAYRDLAAAASVSQMIGSRSEVRYRATVGVAEVQQKADDLAHELRLLDVRIQEKNWLTELIE